LALVGNPEEPIEFAEFHFESGSKSLTEKGGE